MSSGFLACQHLIFGLSYLAFSRSGSWHSKTLRLRETLVDFTSSTSFYSLSNLEVFECQEPDWLTTG